MTGDRVWFGEGRGARVARVGLAPAATAYRVVMAVRNTLFDRGFLVQRRVDLPTVCVGNLSVGGTGKTPIAAWVAGALRARDANPAIVLRGYGADETAVHRQLNPTIPIVVSGDRVRGVARAHAAGADIAVLDDGFQHRRAARDEDIVLVSADRWREPIRLLPAGPWREPIVSLRRATLVVVTRKAAAAGDAAVLAERLASLTRTGAGAVIALRLGVLCEVHGMRRLAVERLRGERVLLVAGVGDPQALARQVEAAGAVSEPEWFPDHHQYTATEIKRLASRAEAVDRVVCTLKDAVKLGDLWPRQAPGLWYFSQRVEVERGSELIDALLDRLLDARRLTTPITAG